MAVLTNLTVQQSSGATTTVKNISGSLQQTNGVTPINIDTGANTFVVGDVTYGGSLSAPQITSVSPGHVLQVNLVGIL